MLSLHVDPESKEVDMFPSMVVHIDITCALVFPVTATFVPSADIAMSDSSLLVGQVRSFVHVVPLVDELQIVSFPVDPCAAAEHFVPSADMAMRTVLP